MLRGSLLAFAFNKANPLIETNVRTVYLHHFFPHQSNVPDKELLSIIEATLDTKNTRDWYYALMDYGSYLKQTLGNNNIQSTHYTKQSIFKGSDRQIRGTIIRTLTTNRDGFTLVTLIKQQAPTDPNRLKTQLTNLIKEGLVEKTARRYSLPG